MVFAQAVRECGQVVPRMDSAARDRPSQERQHFFSLAINGFRYGLEALLAGTRQEDDGHGRRDVVMNPQEMQRRHELAAQFTSAIVHQLPEDIIEGNDETALFIAKHIGFARARMQILTERSEMLQGEDRELDPLTLKALFAKARMQTEGVLAHKIQELNLDLRSAIRECRSFAEGMILGHRPLLVVAQRLPAEERMILGKRAAERTDTRVPEMMGAWHALFSNTFETSEDDRRRINNLCERTAHHWSEMRAGELIMNTIPELRRQRSERRRSQPVIILDDTPEEDADPPQQSSADTPQDFLRQLEEQE